MDRIAAQPVFAGLLSAGLILLPLLLPLLTPISLAAPLPLVLAAWHGGLGAGARAAAVPLVAALAIGQGFVFPLAVGLGFVLFPFLAGWLLWSGWKPVQCGAAALAVGVALLVLGGITVWLTEVDLHAEAAAHMGNVRDQFLLRMRAVEGVDAVVLAEVKARLDQMVRLFELFFSAIVLTGWFIIQVGNLAVAALLGRRWGAGLSEPDTRLVGLRIPFAYVWGLIGLGGAALLLEGGPQLLVLNLALFLLVPYFFQGLGVVQAALDRFGVKSFGRGVVFALFVVWGELLLVTLLLGLFDTWWDFRRRLLQDIPG